MSPPISIEFRCISPIRTKIQISSAQVGLADRGGSEQGHYSRYLGNGEELAGLSGCPLVLTACPVRRQRVSTIQPGLHVAVEISNVRSLGHSVVFQQAHC